VLNPNGQYYAALKKTYDRDFEDIYWAEDAVFLERNSRDFVSRIHKINSTSENITAMLKESPLGTPSRNPYHVTIDSNQLVVKEVYYPKFSPTKPLYDSLRNPTGGYGGLFSVTFHSTDEAIAFYDTLEVLKGPSLGTNFTLR
jgi:cystathionine gamma-synthase